MKIGIANDRPLAVTALKQTLALDPSLQVIWVAANGAEAVEQCARELPDLVLMDLMMPVMNGAEATRRIMAATPCAILVVTVDVGANMFRVFEALGHGALDAIDTPTLVGADRRAAARPLLSKIAMIERMIAPGNDHHGALTASGGLPLVTLGASAGGPSALSVILRGLPEDFAGAVIVVQHLDAQFCAGMADWLGKQSRLPVRMAREDETPARGVVLLAGGDHHLLLHETGRLGFSAEPADYAYRPSIDLFFQSVGLNWPGPAVGALLTGMGRDGALGLKVMRNKGYTTIAQDEASSAVYSMPKAAAAIQAAQHILPLDRIAPKLVEWIANLAGERTHA